MAKSKMWNAVVSYAKANNISRDESFQSLWINQLKVLFPAKYGGAMYEGWHGVIWKWWTSIDGGLKVAASGTASSGSRDNVSESGRKTNTDNHDTSSQAVKISESPLITSPAIKPVHQVTRQIIMQAPAWTSSLRHFPECEKQLRPIYKQPYSQP
jgi:hypothetical protein